MAMARATKIEDVYIAVMGYSGTGKSSFIATSSGMDVKVGHSLISCTADVEDVGFMHSDHLRVHLLDTPGLNDVHRSDVQFLQVVSHWLAKLFKNNIYLKGIIFLHRISDNMTAAAMRSLSVFKQLCGPEAFKCVILATTMWFSVQEAQGDKRERSLIENNKFWGAMCKEGSTVMRYLGTKDSAHEIINHILSWQFKEPVVLRIQKELVTQGKDLQNTSAGVELNAELIRETQRYEGMLAELTQRLEEVSKSKEKEVEALTLQMQREKEEAHRRRMRLIHTETLELAEFTDDDIPLYATLSHRWGTQEPSFQDMTQKRAEGMAGFIKVRNFCQVAASHGLRYAWVDTCCIDKTSSAELSEAVNSMYRWYENSAVCYAFLGDVHLDQSAVHDSPFDQRYPNFPDSKWFERGWTLQELIAPSMLIFLDASWLEIGTKSSLSSILSSITRIPEPILNGEPPQIASIAQRMSWASNRRTTRVEDIAYCLMGLFDVNMPMLYGEGEKAFMRLQEEIIKVSDDHTIFAWQTQTSRLTAKNIGLLARSPAAFSSSHDIQSEDSPNTPDTLSRAISTDNKGIHLRLKFIRAIDWEGTHTAILPCRRLDPSGRLVHIGIPLRAMSPRLQCFARAANVWLRELPLGDDPEATPPERQICIQRGRHHHSRQNAVVKAAECGNQKLLQMLLANGASVESLEDFNQRTPLLAAAKENQYKTVELLIEAGANIEARDIEGCTPLNLAALGGHLATVKVLVNCGAYLDSAATNRRTPILHAAHYGHDHVVQFLMEQKSENGYPSSNAVAFWQASRQ